MKFLGTAAAEGIPNPFCHCPVCENARKTGGKEIRSRSAFRLNEKVMIDLGSDYLLQSILQNEPLHSIQHILYTHTHEDHFDPTAFWERRMRRDGCVTPMTIYMTETDYPLEALASPENQLSTQRLQFQQCYQIDQYYITPLRGDHRTEYEKYTANYLVESSALRLFYALDSGCFLDETISFLQKGKPLDVLITECTFAVFGKDYLPNLRGHLDVNSCQKNLEHLYHTGIIDEHTNVYLTHIAPREATHETLSAYFEHLNLPYKITVAYDGLEI